MATTHPRPEVDPRAAALPGGSSFLVQRDEGAEPQKATVQYVLREPFERVPGIPETTTTAFGDVRLMLPEGEVWLIELSSLEYIVEWLRVNREAQE